MPDHDPGDEALIEEIYAFVWQRNLRPMSLVRYERQAFVGTERDRGLRVTFDTSLSFQARHLRLHEEPSGLPMLPANRVVMEIKVNERIPVWLTELIAAHNLQRVGISKYCRSIDAARNMPLVRQHSFRAESAEEVLATAFSRLSTLEDRMGIDREQKVQQPVPVRSGRAGRLS